MEGDDGALAAWRHQLGGHRQSDENRDRDERHRHDPRRAADQPPDVVGGIAGGHAANAGGRRACADQAVKRPDDLDRPVVVNDDPAVLGEHLARPVGPAQEGHLGEGLSLQGTAGTEGGGAHETRPRRPPGTGVEQVVAVATVRVAPDAHVEAGRGDATRAHEDRPDSRSGVRMLDVDREGPHLRPDAADRDVTAAVDEVAAIGAKPASDRVGAQALTGAPGVEAGAHRPRDDAGLVVDHDLSPPRSGSGRRRAACRCPGQSISQRRRGSVGHRGHVPCRLERAAECRVDETVAASCRPHPGADGGAQESRRGNNRARVPVEHREFAIGEKTRQTASEVPNERSLPVGGLERGWQAR